MSRYWDWLFPLRRVCGRIRHILQRSENSQNPCSPSWSLGHPFRLARVRDSREFNRSVASAAGIMTARTTGFVQSSPIAKGTVSIHVQKQIDIEAVAGDKPRLMAPSPFWDRTMRHFSKLLEFMKSLTLGAALTTRAAPSRGYDLRQRPDTSN